MPRAPFEPAIHVAILSIMSSGLPRTVENSPTQTRPNSSTPSDSYIDSLVSDLNSLGLSPISARDLPKSITDYRKYQLCPQELDPELDPSAILDAYRDLIQYPLSDIIARVVLSSVVVPKTCPQPSADIRDRFNLSIDALWMLKEHLEALPSTSQKCKEPLMEKILDRMMAFIRFYAQEIVAKNRTADFQAAAQHDFHENVLFILSALKYHPLAQGDAHHAFLADIVPPLLLTYPSVNASEHTSIVFLTFHLINTLLLDPVSDECRDRLYANFFRLLDRSPTANDTLASASIMALNFYRDTLLSLDANPVATTCTAIVFACRFLCTFINKEGSTCTALIKGGLTRATCDLFSTTVRVLHMLARKRAGQLKQAITYAGDALDALREHVALRVCLEGHVRVELLFEYDVLYQLREFDRYLHSLSPEASAATFDPAFAKRYFQLQTELLDFVKPYLAFYDILAKAANKFLGQPECAGESPVWKSFVAEIDRFEKDRIVFAKSYRDVCQAPNCPNGDGSKTKLSFSRCSGCQFIQYCSRTCQQRDWQSGHKKHCALIKKERSKTGRLTGLPSRREIYFMNGIACMTLARHAPFARNAVPVGFVRHMDFTASPPVLTIKSLDDPIYNEKTRIVIGEDELMDTTARSRALSFMRVTWEVGVVYYRKFPPGDSFNEVALTFLDWIVAPDGRLLHAPVNLDRFDPSK